MAAAAKLPPGYNVRFTGTEPAINVDAARLVFKLDGLGSGTPTALAVCKHMPHAAGSNSQAMLTFEECTDRMGIAMLAGDASAGGETYFSLGTALGGSQAERARIDVNGLAVDNLRVFESAHILGALNAHGTATFTSNLHATGAAAFFSNVAVHHSLSALSNLTVTSSARMLSNLIVSSSARMLSNVEIVSDAILRGNVSIASNISIGGDARVTSALNVGGALSVEHDATVSGGVRVANGAVVRGGIQLVRGIGGSVEPVVGSADVNGVSLVVASAQQSFRFSASNAELMRLTGSGRLGIGTSNPQYPLDVQVNSGVSAPGVVAIRTDGDVSSLSDARLKTGIARITGALDRLCAIGGYTFQRLHSDSDSERVAGVLAQEVLEVLPEVVHQDPASGMLSVAYPNLIALVIEAVKELRVLTGV